MKHRGLALSILSMALLNAVHAESAHHHLLAPHAQIPQHKIAQLLPNKAQYLQSNNQLATSSTKHLEATQQTRLDTLSNLQAQLSVLNNNEKTKTLLDKQLRQAIASEQMSAENGFHAVGPGMNFLNLQLGDAISLLTAVQSSAEITQMILLEMQKYASDAASGIHSSTQLSQLDAQLQGYKFVLPYVQTVSILNGEKVLSGGDITIRFGNTSSKDSKLTIPIKPFDSQALNLDSISIDTIDNAHNALIVLDAAISHMHSVVAAVQLPLIDDAEFMLGSVPSVLTDDFLLYGSMLIVILEANNGIINDDQRNSLDMYFNYLKAALEKSQTYISLDGTKMLGGGNIDIQIGPKASRETTLHIKLPGTSTKAMGLDKVNLLTEESASNALDVILKDLHDFAYMPGNRY